MRENWFAISIFSVIFGILGYLLGCCGVCCNTSNCCSTDQQCGSQKACSSPVGGKTCCAGGENAFIHEHFDAQAIIHELEMEDFIGDTTIIIDDMTINMIKSADGNVDVQVEMEEGGEWHGTDDVHLEKTVIIMKEEGSEEQ